MYRPTTRVLAVLELLQSHGRMTGAELARRLEVDPRTARRYIETLQDLGIPVEADRGRYGAYRLRPGYKLPPLMFGEEEALALTLGLLAARRIGLADAAHAVEGALAKVERVLPDALRERVRAVEDALVLAIRPAEAAPLNGVVVTLSAAVKERRRVWLRYRSQHAGEETAREFDPYGLVYRDGRWYATGYCHLRRDRRLFRLDRIGEIEPRAETFERPDGFDPLAEVERSIASRPGGWPGEVVREASLEEARARVSPVVALLEPIPEGVLLYGHTENVDWMARYLAGLGFPLVVRRPPELRAALLRLARQLAVSARRGAEREDAGVLAGESA
ncbi:MAG: YafY family transcriptional regulator, partial [Gemmatimonadetes bacterium]|nr:YafY family transcriptional regulator [Gemmatimonadota bacterium]